MRPGFQSSTTIPISPIESISAMMFGSIRRSSSRFQAESPTRSICVSGGVEIVSPFGSVFIPSIWRKRSG